MLGSNQRPPPCRGRTALTTEVSWSSGKPRVQRDFEGSALCTDLLKEHRSSAEVCVNGHRELPIRGHFFSPLVAIFSPHWWPRSSPPIRVVCGWWPRSSPAVQIGSGQWFDPLPGGRLGEPVALGRVSDENVGVVHEPIDGRGRDRFGHQFVEPARVDVGADRAALEWAQGVDTSPMACSRDAEGERARPRGELSNAKQDGVSVLWSGVA